MNYLSEQELDDLHRADDAIQNFLHESATEGSEYRELEKYVSELDDQYFAYI